MDDVRVFIDAVIHGIVNGSLYVVLAIGLTLLFGVARIINLAHGQFFAIGGYLTVLGAVTIGIPAGPVIAGVIAIGLAVGWVLQRILIAPVRVRPATELPLELFLILTLGLSLFLQNVLLAVFGDNPRRMHELIPGNLRIDALELVLPAQWVAVVGAALSITLSLFLFLNRTRFGTAIRATAQDRDAAQAVGIDVPKVDGAVFSISAALGMAAGALAAPILLVYPSLGVDWLLKAIVIVIMGGLGSVTGALYAGYALGIIESVVGTYGPAQYATSVGYLLMVVVLMFRPAGLLGRGVGATT